MNQAVHRWMIGNYIVVASLGEGGMAKVYLALNPARVGRDALVVIKVLREDMSFDERELSEMFVDEARMAVKLVHPNIVRTAEVGQFEGRHFMIMEYLEGQSLYEIQARFGLSAFPSEEGLRIVAETAKGLHYAHELRGASGAPLGIIHRDISPQNVFVTYDGEVKLLDFGIAKAADGTHRTRLGVIKGKLDYMSPEQLQCLPMDRRTDVFALGAMLWETVTGVRFAGGPETTEDAKIQARVTGGEAKVQALRPDTPVALVRIIERAIALDRADRYDTAAEMARDIEGYLHATARMPTARSLAALLATKYGAQRKETRALVDAQIARKREEDASSVPVLSRRSLDSLEQDASLLRLYRPGATASGAVIRSRPGVTGPHAVSLSDAPTEPPSARPVARTRQSSRARIVLGVALFGLAIAIGRFAASRGNLSSSTLTTTPDLAASPPSAPDSRAPQAERAAESTIKLTLEVKPPHARVTLDGSALPAVPYAGSHPADQQTHRLQASADGYRTESLLVSFDRDRTITIVLRKLEFGATPQSPQRHND